MYRIIANKNNVVENTIFDAETHATDSTCIGCIENNNAVNNPTNG